MVCYTNNSPENVQFQNKIVDRYSFRELMCHGVLGCFQLPPTDKNYLSALWGKLASEILMQDWETALDDLNRIKEVIESNTMNVSILYQSFITFFFILQHYACSIYCLISWPFIMLVYDSPVNT